MSNAAVEKPVEQPESFAFNAENLAVAEKIIAKYPKGRQASALIPLLDIAQRVSIVTGYQRKQWIMLQRS